MRRTKNKTNVRIPRREEDNSERWKASQAPNEMDDRKEVTGGPRGVKYQKGYVFDTPRASHINILQRIASPLGACDRGSAVTALRAAIKRLQYNVSGALFPFKNIGFLMFYAFAARSGPQGGDQSTAV